MNLIFVPVSAFQTVSVNSGVFNMGVGSRLVVARAGRGEWDGWGELGVNGGKPLPLDWTSNEGLLCSPGNYI